MAKHKDPTERETPNSVSKKAPYSRPNLLLFGSAASLTKGGGGSHTDGGGMPHTMSDPRTKEKVNRVGTHWSGVGLYLFDYILSRQAELGRGRQFGVMADEVEAVIPEAVILGSDGLKRVNYSML
ncbi:MAG: tail fiber domain-containing protein [Halioglobus sp.]